MPSPTGVGRRLAGAVLVALLAAGLAACGGGGGDDEKVKAIEPLPAELLPPEILGLAVSQEDIAEKVEGPGQVYIEALGFYSLRLEDALQATVQVARFNDDADWRDGRFRRSIVSGISTSRPTAVQVGDKTVFLSSGAKQSISVWFDGRLMWVLSAREEFERPRSLLRALVDLEVKA